MDNKISLKNVLASLICSIDTFNYLLKDHHRRTAIIAFQLGNIYGLEKRQMDDLILAASLHDIGALNVTERDQLMHVDVTNPRPHEKKGALMLSGFQPFMHIGRIINRHHVHFIEVENGEINASDVPVECYFLHLADRIDILLHHYNDDHESVVSHLLPHFGTTFAPFLQETFMTAAEDFAFWHNIQFVSFQDLLLRTLDDTHYNLDHEGLEALAKLFGQIIDFRSPWTTKHSETVSRLAFRLGELMGFSEDSCFDLKIAGYIHDIGKIGVPTELLNMPHSLTPSDFAHVKNHVVYSTLILSPIKEFGNIINLVSQHHEKRDRTGYPMKPQEINFTLQNDVLAFADIFSALSEDRPYRKRMDENAIRQTLSEFTPEKLCESVYQVILQNFDELLSIALSSKKEVHLDSDEVHLL